MINLFSYNRTYYHLFYYCQSFVMILLLIFGFGAVGFSDNITKYSTPDLPPLLQLTDGTPVKTPEDWTRRKVELRELMQQYFIGFYPKEVPAIRNASVTQVEKKDDGSTRQRIQLTFDTPHSVTCEICVWIPKGKGPFPVLLTPPRFYQIEWANDALRRGYLVCLYPGVDSHHHEDNYPGYERVWESFRRDYPQATWTEISTKAWIASRALDYLLNPKSGYDIARDQIAITGFSRYGKQALIAAAFDERITAVVARSPGSPGSCPYRFTSRNSFSEAPGDFPDEWFLQSLRSYTGRENELPIDAHAWMGLIAPRYCLIHTAYNDDSDPTFAAEQSYREAQTVYRFLGFPDHLRLQYREGSHEPVTEEHRKQNLDWFDLAFHRGTAKAEDFPEIFLHNFDWKQWSEKQGTLSEEGLNSIEDKIRWMLGEKPDIGACEEKYTLLSDDESAMMTHDRWKVENTARIPIAFGASVRGNLYYNPTLTPPLPVLIWLHPYSYGSGYNEGCGVENTAVYFRMAQAGFAVVAFDQCGFGLRLLEGSRFYETHPRYSRFGRMIDDVSAAVDFIQNGKGASKTPLPALRKDRIFVLGYALGGMTGLYAAALDARITGAASFCGFTPLRSDSDDKPDGGIRRLWEWHALLPRLGYFQNRQNEIPYDYDNILARIAPRPTLVYAPTHDREADSADVAACIESARQKIHAAGKTDALTYQAPDDINRLQIQQQDVFLDWMKTYIR